MSQTTGPAINTESTTLSGSSSGVTKLMKNLNFNERNRSKSNRRRNGGNNSSNKNVGQRNRSTSRNKRGRSGSRGRRGGSRKRSRNRSGPRRAARERNDDDLHPLLLEAYEARIPTPAVDWLFYALDPMGSKESGLVRTGSAIQIPDGALKKGVAGEARQVDFINCPGIDDSVLPLDGKTWTPYVMSLPAFRLHTIWLATKKNDELTDTIMNLFAAFMNKVILPENIAATEWKHLTGSWYVKILFWRVINRIPRPLNNAPPIVTKWRTTGKAFDFIFNAPTLINQGMDLSGQFQQDVATKTIEMIMTADDMTPVMYNIVSTLSGVVEASNSYTFTDLRMVGPASVVGLTPGPVGTTQTPFTVVTGAVNFGIVYTTTSLFSIGGTVVAVGTPVQWMIINSGVSGSGLTFSLLDMTVPATPVGIHAMVVPQAALIVYAVYSFQVHIKDPTDGEKAVNTSVQIVTLPPMSSQALTNTDPAYCLDLSRRTDGGYVVPFKFGNLPTWQFTESSTFSPIKFKHTEDPTDTPSLSGIFDTIDVNLSVAVTSFHGISQSAQIVVNGVFGWEGMATSDSTLAMVQFDGECVSPCAIDLYNGYISKHRGLYPAKANFFMKVFSSVVGFLRNIICSQASREGLIKLGGDVAGLVHDKVRNKVENMGS